MLRIAIVFLSVFLTFAVGHARPNLSKVKAAKTVTSALSDFSYIDPDKKISRGILNYALLYFKKNKNKFDNHNYIGIIDYTKHASKPRFFIIDMRTGKVESYLAAHGKGSDPKGTGWASRFSNRDGTLATSVGFYRTKGIYRGKHGRSLRLEGLSKTNSKAYQRAVVIHSARYVDESRRYTGRSWGCPAVDKRVIGDVIAKLQGGAMIYAYGGENPKHF